MQILLRQIKARLRNAVPDFLRTFARDERGASIIVIGLMMPALIGSMGLAAEVSYWHLHQRAMQNAADAAAIAAASNLAVQIIALKGKRLPPSTASRTAAVKSPYR